MRFVISTCNEPHKGEGEKKTKAREILRSNFNQSCIQGPREVPFSKCGVQILWPGGIVET